MPRRIAVFGGIYNNCLTLAATLADAKRRDVEAILCLGDLGGLGPHPDRVFPLLKEAGVLVIQRNYDEAFPRIGRRGGTDRRVNTAAGARPGRQAGGLMGGNSYTEDRSDLRRQTFGHHSDAE